MTTVAEEIFYVALAHPGIPRKWGIITRPSGFAKSLARDISGSAIRGQRGGGGSFKPNGEATENGKTRPKTIALAPFQGVS